MNLFYDLPRLKLAERQTLPQCSAIYFAVAAGQVLYVGQAKNLQERWKDHHRCPQLSQIDRKQPVELFWLTCSPQDLDALEQQYINEYCPTLNQTKVPTKKIVPSFRLLTSTLERKQGWLIGFGYCPISPNKPMKTLVLGYLANGLEIRGVANKLHKSLHSINKKPGSLFQWIETIKRQADRTWRSRCNGVEIYLTPLPAESSVLHHPSLYNLMWSRKFGDVRSLPKPDYDLICKEVKLLSYDERLELAKATAEGQKLFPLQCQAQFRSIAGVKVLCLTQSQLSMVCAKQSYLMNRYPGLQAIVDDPIPPLDW